MTLANPLEFSQLLASRICHDLISPVSAVNNGLELLLEEDENDPEARRRALELIEDSAKISALKLKLMRAAFGAGQSLPDSNTPTNLLMLCQPIADKNKIQILWDHSDEITLNRDQGRIMLNLILILLESLPRGGMIEISQTQNHINCTVQSQKIIFPENKIAFLQGVEDAPFEPRYIGFIILKLLLNKMAYDVEKKDTMLSLSLDI